MKEKTGLIVEKVIGQRKDDMIYLSLLATDPAFQGRGYGSALVEHVTSIADAQDRAAWLISSNNGNTAFYNSHGFFSAGEVILGNDNPTWNQAPVIVPVMIRERKSLRIDEKC